MSHIILEYRVGFTDLSPTYGRRYVGTHTVEFENCKFGFSDGILVIEDTNNKYYYPLISVIYVREKIKNV